MFCIVEAQSLDSLLSQAYNSNPELRALRLEYQAAMLKGPQVGQLAEPTLGIGVAILPTETRLGSQNLVVTASQMFPWFGTLNARENVALSMAKSKYELLAAKRLDIDYQIKTAYYNLYLLNRLQRITRDNIQIVESIEALALANVESGKSISSDVLRVRIRLEELYQHLELLEARKTGFAASINAATSNPVNHTIEVDTTTIEIAELIYDLEYVKLKVESNHPLIRQLDWNIKTSNDLLALNTLNGRPNFGLGLDYGLVNGRSDAFPVNNGRDILVPKMMITIPIYRKKYGAVRQEEEIKQQALAFRKEYLTDHILASIQGHLSEYESAKLLHNLSNLQIDISTSAYNILLAEYSSSGKRFDELVELQSDINSYEIEVLQAIVQTHLSKFEIERLTDF
jgi:outer membrane protein TolC